MEISKEVIESIIRGLLQSGCLFAHCDGYEDPPKDMITCHRCYALYMLIKEHPELKQEVT
jgi:hypothetical protein